MNTGTIFKSSASLVRVLELRCAEGAGGGPEKTILTGASIADRERVSVTIAYLRPAKDLSFIVGERARSLNLDYLEIAEMRRVDPRTWSLLRKVVRERNIDIVHSHDYKTDLLALMLARRTGIVPLATAHGWTGHSLRERWLYYPLDRRVLRYFPLVVAVSSNIRDRLIRSGLRETQVRVILNAIDHQRFVKDPLLRDIVRQRLGIQTEHRVIGAIGRLEPQKRFDLLIDVVASLSPTHPELQLLIAGEGSCRGQLEGQVDRMGMRERVRFLGHAENIFDIYHAIDLFVQSSDYEGTSNAVLEAMAMEIPIVATDVGGTAELAEHEKHAYLVPPRATTQLASAILEVLTDPSKTAKLVRNARARIESTLSFDRRTRAVERIYQELANNGTTHLEQHGCGSLPKIA